MASSPKIRRRKAVFGSAGIPRPRRLDPIGPCSRQVALYGGAFGWTKRQLKPKRRAWFRIVIGHSNLAAHGLYQLLANRQSQAGAAKAATGGAVGLNEGLENALTGRFRDANSRINYFASQPGTVFRRLEAHLHPAGVRKLDSVRNQVCEDLAETHTVAED